MRGDAFTRQLRLLQLLETRRAGVGPDEAAEELGSGRRTVYRDFDVLQRAGFPLVSDTDGRRARWRIDDGYRHRLHLSLSWSEVLALSTGAELMKGLAGTLFHEGAVSALEKIRSTLPKPLAERVRAGQVATSATSGGHDYRSRAATAALLVEALTERRTVAIRYRTKGAKARQRLIDPYHMRVTGEGLYLIARDHDSGRVKTFLLDRVDEVQKTEAPFAVDPTFDAARFLESGFAMYGGDPVEVRFTVAADAARLLMERKVHPSQQTQKQSDGSVEVRLRVPLVPPLSAWLAGMGGSVSRVSPAKLSNELAEIHARAVELLGAQQARREARRTKSKEG